MEIESVNTLIDSIKPFTKKDDSIKIGRRYVEFLGDGVTVNVNCLGQLLTFDHFELPFAKLDKLAAIAKSYMRFNQVGAGRYTMETYDHEAEINGTEVESVDYISMKDYHSIGRMDANLLQTMIKKALPYASTDENRPAINTIHYHSDGINTAYIESTDGFHYLRQSIDPCDQRYLELHEADFLMTAQHAKAFAKVLQTRGNQGVHMYMHKSAKKVLFEMFDDRLTYNFIFDLEQNTYPDTQFIMDSLTKPSKFTVFFAKRALLETLKKIQKIKSKDVEAITFMYTASVGESKIIYDSELDYSGDTYSFVAESALVKGQHDSSDVVFGCGLSLLMHALDTYDAENIVITGVSHREPLRISCTMQKSSTPYPITDTVVIMPNHTRRVDSYYGD
ncbi:hypothetical protein IH575_04575 [Candidatus Dojkabacteria bacterium]|nr:hypothetical protein [Candidatus Dojkabacteria bacterium]